MNGLFQSRFKLRKKKLSQQPRQRNSQREQLSLGEEAEENIRICFHCKTWGKKEQVTNYIFKVCVFCSVGIQMTVKYRVSNLVDKAIEKYHRLHSLLLCNKTKTKLHAIKSSILLKQDWKYLYEYKAEYVLVLYYTNQDYLS